MREPTGHSSKPCWRASSRAGRLRVARCIAVIAVIAVIAASRYDGPVYAQADHRPRLSVARADDFEVTGTGDHAAWHRVEWTALRRRQPDGHPYDSRFKMLHSTTGLYFLM